MNEVSLTVYAVVTCVNLISFLFGYYVEWDALEYCGICGAVSATIVWIFSEYKKNNRDAGTTRL